MSKLPVSHISRWLLALLCPTAAACTHTYTASEYALTLERLPVVQASAPVAVFNAQQRRANELIFGIGSHTWIGSYHQISQQFADQLARSLHQLGVSVVRDQAPKRLDVAIDQLTASSSAFHNRGRAAFSVVTGDGQRFELVANNASPGNVTRTLNGTIAIAVLETLKHPGVQAYLSQPSTPATP